MRNYGRKQNKHPPNNNKKETQWRWIGHTLHKLQSTTERHALDRNPQGTRKRRRPRSWKRTTEWVLQKDGKSWMQATGLALDRRNQVEELHDSPMFHIRTKGESEN